MSRDAHPKCINILNNAFDIAQHIGINDMIQPPPKSLASELMGLFSRSIANSWNLALKVQNWKGWAYTNDSCHIHLGKHVIGAGVYQHDIDSPNYVQPSGAGLLGDSEFQYHCKG
eukprot:scaffold138402_cov20-Tisochrysis_lutea.AAC.1